MPHGVCRIIRIGRHRITDHRCAVTGVTVYLQSIGRNLTTDIQFDGFGTVYIQVHTFKVRLGRLHILKGAAIIVL